MSPAKRVKPKVRAATGTKKASVAPSPSRRRRAVLSSVASGSEKKKRREEEEKRNQEALSFAHVLLVSLTFEFP
jgi:hypothetical protein